MSLISDLLIGRRPQTIYIVQQCLYVDLPLTMLVHCYGFMSRALYTWQ